MDSSSSQMAALPMAPTYTSADQSNSHPHSQYNSASDAPMKVVNKWNRRLLRAVRRTNTSSQLPVGQDDEQSVGSNDDDIRISDGRTGSITRTVHRRTRESIMRSLPPPGQLQQNSQAHIDLLYALAYPKRADKDLNKKNMQSQRRFTAESLVQQESKAE
mmetsp:Transcript_3448/g.4554  ORF Transcript_3448/g.4554 Transcript_3448/m.4554 type:complete len:160 (-) Transcript_3448:484-963(-)